MDKIKITILENGVIKMESDRISAANHMTAEGFLREIAKAAGGEVVVARKGTGHVARTDYIQNRR